MKPRHLAILELLNQDETLAVNALARRLSVSSVTIRKDLDALEARGLLRRQHGQAVRVSHDDIGYHMIFEYDLKQRIAERACEMISHGEAVMIESGSTCAMLAREIAKNKRDVTIITNSAFIGGHVRMIPGVRVILLGGFYDPEGQLTTGPLVRKCAEQFSVDKFFIGTEGYDPARGFFNSDMACVEAMHSMGEHASKRIILTTSQKFNRRGNVFMLPDQNVHALVTDSIPDNCRESLEGNGVEIILARQEGE